MTDKSFKLKPLPVLVIHTPLTDTFRLVLKRPNVVQTGDVGPHLTRPHPAGDVCGEGKTTSRVAQHHHQKSPIVRASNAATVVDAAPLLTLCSNSSQPAPYILMVVRWWMVRYRPWKGKSVHHCLSGTGWVCNVMLRCVSCYVFLLLGERESCHDI